VNTENCLSLCKQFVCLRGFGCLNSPEENGELFLAHFVAPQQRLKRIHQEHLESDKLGDDMCLHFSAVSSHCVAQQHITYRFAWRFALCLGGRQDLLLLIGCQLCTYAPRARPSVCDMYWLLFLSSYDDFVASENVVKLRLLAVRTSASLPRKPMAF
jgi:hypothetical protein